MEDKIQMLIDADGYIDNTRLGIEKLTNKINSGQERSGINLIVPIVENIEKIINEINSSFDLHKGNISIKNMNEILQEIIEAVENEDYILVGDLFQYEFLPLLEKIQNDIQKFI